MAELICPNCKRDTFSWTIDEGQNPLTIWGCRSCKYSAHEDESFEKNCKDCGTKTEIRLEDDQKKYWWCSRCNKVSLINE